MHIGRDMSHLDVFRSRIHTSMFRKMPISLSLQSTLRVSLWLVHHGLHQQPSTAWTSIIKSITRGRVKKRVSTDQWESALAAANTAHWCLRGAAEAADKGKLEAAETMASRGVEQLRLSLYGMVAHPWKGPWAIGNYFKPIYTLRVFYPQSGDKNSRTDIALFKPQLQGNEIAVTVIIPSTLPVYICNLINEIRSITKKELISFGSLLIDI